MSVSVALIRGINMLGQNPLKMADLAAVFEEIGCAEARTYLQSGNVVFRGRSVTRTAIRKGIEARAGFAPRVQIWSRRGIKAAAKANPFVDAAEAEPRKVHTFFLERPLPDDFADRVASVRAGACRYDVIGKTLYLFTPDGFGPSRLGAKIERELKGISTARNWNTVRALCALADDMAARGRQEARAG
ncbi:MAG: DUF1697 domain-containing protein [Alphaproteobacteria bacterium]|nr:DUF1697 domain-containing protein [Alphaproteobacteria bacterium]